MRLAQAFAASVCTALALAALAACVREGAVVVAPIDVADVGDAGPAPLLVVVAVPSPPSLPSAHDRCTARLRAATIKTNPGCTLDERISQGDGVLSFPCAGIGELEATFGEHHFRGTTVNAGTVHLQLTTELDVDDGCHWETQQSIRGEWRREGRDGKPSKLVWIYSEQPVQGTGCFGSCTARAEIEVDALTP